MTRNNRYTNNGFTLVELMVVVALASVMTLAVGVLLSNSQKSWNRLYDRAHSDETIDSFAAQAAFDVICRKASTQKYVISDSGDSLELYYWDLSSTSSTPENYARFYQDDDEVFLERGTNLAGTWQPDTVTSTVMIARNVDSLKFTAQGTSIQMFMNYTDTDYPLMVCSAVRHND